MIREEHGNLLRADVDALVNTVNTVGVMGKGIALQFKRAYPDMFKEYERAAKANRIHVGEMFVWETGALDGPRFIVNFPTKRHWRSASRLDDIALGLRHLAAVIDSHGIRSIAIPPLGCGNGGLDWAEVAPLIWDALRPLATDVEILVFPPEGAPPAVDMPTRTTAPRMTAARAAVVKLLKAYEEYSFHEATLIEVQKLTYFLQAAGENLRLDFVKGRYGPYADDLRKTLREIEGHFIVGFGDGSAQVMSAEPLQVIDAAAGRAEQLLATDPRTAARVERVIELTDGFTSMYGLELLATVHWAATREHARRHGDVVRIVQSWTKRKKSLFTENHIDNALDRLSTHNWIPPFAA
ncbi:type II toxin-antitoxin system antitoxin DNA ADP-ribosyl glycohydrolase DarG [Nocardia farcinica]|uniref:type II toxin-antitoxin system antitoxin DNA ADP-ribosyl glycohydrolase DarG n=1 Tax=Nocardia farcinica TaxID=37329 RepID=UPI00189538E2|nr:macro domain-containing protein [Nocardia farcinica]MBF6293684.1 macro domain-containing protein [Nocardia farcinica]MBF6380540.1 macro domain-containing protein [Nocardia farcinica]